LGAEDPHAGWQGEYVRAGGKSVTDSSEQPTIVFL